MNERSHSTTAPAQPERRPPAKNRLPEMAPVILEASGDRGYALLDSGNGRKLERYGAYVIERPEGQA
ncbi:MAG TPA: class I SAM-dependent rRNA methyltransferase, partial [Rhizobiaceae bacterium]|nr:class I SAM-dependent rRNA methyltransferase [Rhizobiaceae bacterium]